ncbi:monoacylglycerol lipase ABHD6-like [Clarias magur]|uniref:Monoacylglycerol lipase ABHD6-like n=1 Tax=Clarias magur TaxID=1594786 RepID=A0A8J4UCD2_CLAMG|nr:monoacylglycerol lipase ABHD6-like [Clarias magur]
MDLEAVTLFAIALGTLAVPLLLFMASFMLWPSSLIKFYFWYWRRTLGLQVYHADCGGYRFCYSSRGKPSIRPSVLMLHDFSSHKDTWLSLIKYLPKHLHLLCVDMPGHEGTTRTSAEDYSIQGQVRRIRQFVETIHLNRKPFHLVGNSMGGNVAGVYAACYPSDVCSMTLICPTGVKYHSKIESEKNNHELELSEYTLGITLIPHTPQEMEDMLKFCSHVRFKVPQQVLDVSGAWLLAEALPSCRVDVLENCGHSVVMERPRHTAKLILDFIISQQCLLNATSKKKWNASL